MNLRILTLSILGGGAGLFGSHVSAEVSLHPLFSDHAVLQRDKPLPVWGTASPGEKVTVTFNGETRATTADPQGRWMVKLPPQKVSTTPRTLTVKGTNQLEVKDILVGDVWLGSGQSNMDWTVHGSDGESRIRAAAPNAHDGIRIFKVAQAQADEPQTTIPGDEPQSVITESVWLDSRTDHALQFSATLFFFAEALHERQPEVPLGLIRSSVGATNAYSWIPNEVRDQDPGTAYLRQWWGNAIKGWSPEKQAERDQEIRDYEAKEAEYKARNEKLPEEFKKPGELIGPKWSRRPSAFYNGMIAPLQPFALRGMIWYQGEWDAKHDWVKSYRDTLVALGTSWRKHWAETSGERSLGEFPVYIVQLPSREPGDGDHWPYMREVQEQISTTLPHSGMIVTFDTNDGSDLHPPEKTEIGKRLALLALGKEYGADVSWHGPRLKSHRANGKHLVLEFDPGAETLESADGEGLRLFEVAGEDGRYVAASAQVKGNFIALSSPEVAQPVFARYAWAPAPANPNFTNSAGLPASPFRTDEQPVPEKK